MLNPSGFNDWPVRGDPRIAALVRRVGLAVRGGGMRNAVWTFGQGLLTVGAAIALILGLRHFVPGWPAWVSFAGIAAVTIVSGRFLLRARMRTNEGVLAGVIVAEGLCPCCGYNLHGLTPEGDGCYVCPECSSAWKAHRVVRTEAFAAGTREGDAMSALRSTVSAGDKWTTLDVRGWRVELVHPRLRRQIRTCTNDARRARLLAARSAISHDARWVRYPLLALAWLLGVGMCGLCIYFAVDIAEVGPMVGGVFFLILPIAATFGNVAYSPRRVRDRLLAMEMCPTCTTDLIGESPDDRGVRVCRACLSAWRIDPAGPAQDGPSTRPLS